MFFFGFIFIGNLFFFASAEAQIRKTGSVKKIPPKVVKLSVTANSSLQSKTTLMQAYCASRSELVLNFYFHGVYSNPLLLKDKVFITKNNSNVWDAKTPIPSSDFLLANAILQTIAPEEMEFFVPGLVQKTKKQPGSINTIIIKKQQLQYDDLELIKEIISQHTGKPLTSNYLGCSQLISTYKEAEMSDQLKEENEHIKRRTQILQ